VIEDGDELALCVVFKERVQVAQNAAIVKVGSKKRG
jgi:hypothetical protein